MKKTKLIMPIVASFAAIAPAVMTTACNNKTQNITVLNGKELKSKDSTTVYKFKLDTVPANKKVTVVVYNKSEEQEQVVLYDADGYYATKRDFDVADDGTVEVKVGYILAPIVDATTDFALTFSFLIGTNITTDKVDDLKFTYNVEFGVELSKQQYVAKQTAPAAEHWATTNKTVGEIYMDDILKNPEIFQDDARYSTSSRIREDIEKGIGFKNIDSFASYYNDIEKEGNGLHVHMNYEVKGMQDNSEFTFKQNTSGMAFKFTKFDFKFSFETAAGYNFEFKKAETEGKDNKFIIKDTSVTPTYTLIGRFSGSFVCEVTDTTSHTETHNVSKLECIIADDGKTEVTKEWLALMLASGIIHYTYDFAWGTELPELTILSPYSKNAQ